MQNRKTPENLGHALQFIVY